MVAILITQCLQRDFVQPLERYQPLPNRLHIGFEEARRLLGENLAEGPIARMMSWAYQQPDDQLKLIHIRDWHDSHDPHQQDHLAQFGPHCLQGTAGADFAFEIPPHHGKNVSVVNTLTLNDFQGTTLEEILTPYTKMPLKLGLMGVWTEAKILFLTYELKTRYPQFEIGICSALTASSSRSQHFIALKQLEKLFGVQTFASVAGFVAFLGGQTDYLLPKTWQESRRPVLVLDSMPGLSETDSRLVRYLFRDSRVVKLKRLQGGYSGNEVLGAESIDIYGHQQVPHVLKLGAHDLIGQERMAFEQVETVLGNNAPRITDFAELAQRGAIKYRYASMGGTITQTFQSLYQNQLSAEQTWEILHRVFVEQLGRFYRAAQYEPLNLLSYYQFSPDWAPRIQSKVEAIIGTAATGDTLVLAGQPVYNLCRFYAALPELFSQYTGKGCYVSYVHGDLNGANIILDRQENVWLIDFFHTHRGHVLRDLIKLENDILYLMTELNGPEDLPLAFMFTDCLLNIEDLHHGLPALPELVAQHEGLKRAWRTLGFLRSLYRELVHADRNPQQVLIGQLRYAAHTLGFEEANLLQKTWALYTACRLAEKLQAQIRTHHQLQIHWLKNPAITSGQLGLTILPGRQDMQRDLASDLQSIQAQGVRHIVTLLVEDEFEKYGVPKLLEAYQTAGFEVYHQPILDQKICSQAEMRQLIHWIKARMDSGAQIVVHCVGGLGRAGTVAACYLRKLGLEPSEAITAVRAARSARAIESAVQEEFIHEFQV